MRARSIASWIFVAMLTTSLVIQAPAANAHRAVAVAAGDYHTCALTLSGGVRCWGANWGGQLGDGTKIDSPVAVDVLGLSSGVAAIAAGGAHTCALTNSGGVKCWGDYPLGDGAASGSSKPVDVVGLSSGVAAITAGEYHTCALTDTGGVKCWGDGSSGAVGDGTTHRRLRPVDVLGLSSGIAAISAGGFHTCALTDAGGVECWGNNRYGQLGDGTRHRRLRPVDVLRLSSDVAAISGGDLHTCALTDTGGVKCWGFNDYGELGDGTTHSRTRPVNVIGLSSGVAAIAAGGWGACALTDAGGVKCWGDDGSGALGDGVISYVARTRPVNVVGLSSGVAALELGEEHTCAVTSLGGLKCWGANDGSQASRGGQLGDGTFSVFRPVPITVRGFLGGDHTAHAPDASIARMTSGPWVGQDVYDRTGKTEVLSATVSPGTTVSFRVRLMNESETLGQYFAEGSWSGSGSRFHVRCLSGTRRITFGVLEGSWWVQLAPGARAAISIQITVAASLPHGSQLAVLLRERSANDGREVDAVRAVVTVI